MQKINGSEIKEKKRGNADNGRGRERQIGETSGGRFQNYFGKQIHYKDVIGYYYVIRSVLSVRLR